jgi:hypothetical protein
LAQQQHWRLDPEARTATHLSSAPLVLSSFTKSYIAGHAADAVLATGNASSVVVNIGGDLAVRGAWSEPIDIADPKADAENDPPIAQLAIHDSTVATSGNYRRGVEVGGTHHSHIVDPRTGPALRQSARLDGGRSQPGDRRCQTVDPRKVCPRRQAALSAPFGQVGSLAAYLPVNGELCHPAVFRAHWAYADLFLGKRRSSGQLMLVYGLALLFLAYKMLIP